MLRRYCAHFNCTTCITLLHVAKFLHRATTRYSGRNFLLLPIAFALVEPRLVYARCRLNPSHGLLFMGLLIFVRCLDACSASSDTGLQCSFVDASARTRDFRIFAYSRAPFLMRLHRTTRGLRHFLPTLSRYARAFSTSVFSAFARTPPRTLVRWSIAGVFGRSHWSVRTGVGVHMITPRCT